MYLPIILIVASNVFYHICSKETPAQINPFASLTVTYAVGLLTSLLLFWLTGKGSSLIAEYRHVNWAVVVFGLSIVGLEAGYIAMYKAGWNISTGSLIASVLLAIALIVVGALLYKEAITLRKLAGVLICLVGLYLINH